jgi:hypothetical protein
MKILVTIPVEVEVPEKAVGLLGKFGESLNYTLADWNDGRYSFDSEMLQRGLRNAVESALHRTVDMHFQEIYGNEMIDLGNGSATNRGGVESSEVLWTCRVRVHIEEVESALDKK